MLKRNLDSGNAQRLVWEDLANGVPTIAALANLCSAVLADPQYDSSESSTLDDLPAESLAILQLAVRTGLISIRGDKNAFEPAERYLAVCVERTDGERFEFRVHHNPEQTIRFVEGFRQLCRHGLVMHQIMNEFSLTAAGFELAKSVDESSIANLVAMGRSSV